MCIPIIQTHLIKGPTKQYWSIVLDQRKPMAMQSSIGSTKTFRHGFKNRTGPAGPTSSTGNRHSIRSGYSKKPEIVLKPINSENRPVPPENRKPERSDRFCKIAESLKQICNGAFFAVKILFFSQCC